MGNDKMDSVRWDAATTHAPGTRTRNQRLGGAMSRPD